MHIVLQPSSMAARAPEPYKLLYGIDMLRSRMAAMEAGRYNRREHYQNYWKTWEDNLAGTRVTNSTELAKLQQVASLSF